MKTVVIVANNTVPYLEREVWLNFIKEMNFLTDRWCYGVEFDNEALENKPRWSSYCWVTTVTDEHLEPFKRDIADVLANFGKTRVHMTVGETHQITKKR